MELLKLQNQEQEAIGEIKKLVTDYRKSICGGKQIKVTKMAKLFEERIPFKPFEYPIYYNEGWLKHYTDLGYTEIPVADGCKGLE